MTIAFKLVSTKRAKFTIRTQTGVLKANESVNMKVTLLVPDDESIKEQRERIVFTVVIEGDAPPPVDAWPAIRSTKCFPSSFRLPPDQQVHSSRPKRSAFAACAVLIEIVLLVYTCCSFLQAILLAAVVG